MAIVTTKTLLTDKKPELVRKQVLPAPKPVTVDTAYESRANLLQFVSGSRWIVTYYKQVKTSEEASEAFNINRPLPYQQYKKIENFEIRVTSPLQASPNNENSSMTLQGVGLIYPSIVPDHGDTFIADIGDGRLGLFNIMEVTQKSHLKDTVYEIEYQVVDWVSHESYAALEEKVVHRAYYERDFAAYGHNPVLNEEEHGLFNELTRWQCRIVRHYIDCFFNLEYSTFLVPVPGMVVYDPFIVEFIRRIWSSTDNQELNHLTVYNRDNHTNKFIKTIWNAIIDADPYTLMTVKSNFGIIPRRLFLSGAPGLVSVTYSRLDYIYHPLTVIDTELGEYEVPNMGKIEFKEHYRNFPTGRKLTIPLTKLPGLGFVHPELQQYLPTQDAKKYGTFETYVLSEAFYKNERANMSKVERMLMDSLHEKPIEAKELLPILKDCINWGEVERFYYIPLLWSLSRVALGGLTE